MQLGLLSEENGTASNDLEHFNSYTVLLCAVYSEKGPCFDTSC